MLEELRFILDTVSISPYLNKQIGKVRKIVSANAESNTSELIEIVSQILKISADKSEELLILSTKEKTSIDEYQSMLESGEGMQDDKLEDMLKSDCLNPEDLMLATGFQGHLPRSFPRAICAECPVQFLCKTAFPPAARS